MNRFRMTAATLGLLSACLVPSMRADDSNKETRLTINQPLQIQDTLLAPGQYVFKLAEPDTSRSVVGVYNADSNRLEGFIMGWAAYRTDAGDKHLFTISQPEGNQPAKLQTWFYPGDNFGVEFSVSKRAQVKPDMYSNPNGNGRNAGAADETSSTRD